MDTHRAMDAPIFAGHHSIFLQEEVFGRILVERNSPPPVPTALLFGSLYPCCIALSSVAEQPLRVAKPRAQL